MPSRRPPPSGFLPGFDAEPARFGAYGVPSPVKIERRPPAESTAGADEHDARPAPRAEIERGNGEKAKARDILAAVRTLKLLESERRPATTDERDILARFGGFGPVALSLVPDPITGTYKDGWQPLGDELRDLLTPEEYESARRSTFCAFYTSPLVMQAMHEALSQFGLRPGSTVLEPGCGIGRFITDDHRFIGVELDAISGRIARALHPSHDIRIENFRDSTLPPLDAVLGNVPFADIKLDFKGRRFSLHDFFFAKSVDSLKPGGVVALVTSRYTLDKQNAAIREHLASQADFLGAIRLPSDAFKREGTAVVTDIVFLRKRAPGQEPNHVNPRWIESSPLSIDGTDVTVNRYFHDHPEMVLGTWTTKDTLYGEGLSVASNGDLAEQLRAAIRRLPEAQTVSAPEIPRPPPFIPPPLDRHITEGGFFVSDQAICQSANGQAVPVTLGSSVLKANGTMMGKRLAHLIELRDNARRVLQSQNQGWPQAHRDEARRKLNFSYDRFASAYGPINKTTFGETKNGTTIRRMPNLVKFRDDPDAMLVMALEEYDESTGKASKAPILLKDVVGPMPAITAVASAEEGLLVSLDRKSVVDLAYIARLYGKPEREITAELGDLIYLDPETTTWQTADEYLSGNVREKLKAAEEAGPDYARNAEALRQVQPEDLLPGDIDANLGAPWIPTADVEAFARELFKSEGITIGYLKRDAVWGVEADYAAESSVAATSDYGTPRANGVSLFDQALNMKTPVIYDVVYDGDRETRVVNQEETLAAREKQRLIKERFKTWVFADPDRTERLVRIYNDTYNNLRPRLFDGSHLDFPGMSRAFELRPHQRDAVWRGMSSGNTLLAHAVGAGKTSCMVATGMKMKQAGLAKKPMYVVPNHMLEQVRHEDAEVIDRTVRTGSILPFRW